jgi:hypothetical protein
MNILRLVQVSNCQTRKDDKKTKKFDLRFPTNDHYGEVSVLRYPVVVQLVKKSPVFVEHKN